VKLPGTAPSGFALYAKTVGPEALQGAEFIACAWLGSLLLYLFGQPTKADFLAVRFPVWNPGLMKDVACFVIYVIVGGVIGYFYCRARIGPGGLYVWLRMASTT